MSTATTTAPAPHVIDPAKAFKVLQDAMLVDSEFGRRVNSHIQATSGHTSIVNFMANGSPDEQKGIVLRHCLRAWKSGDYTTLLEPKAETETEAEVEKEADESEVEEEASETEEEEREPEEEEILPSVALPPPPPPRPLLKVSPQANRLQEALALLSEQFAQPEPAVDEARIAEIVEEILKKRPQDTKRIESTERMLNDVLAKMQTVSGTVQNAESALANLTANIQKEVLAQLQGAVGQRISLGLASGEVEMPPEILPVDTYYIQSEVGVKIERAIRKGHNVIVSGPSGSGKTFPLEMELRKANRSYIGPLSCGAGMSKKDMRARESLRPVPGVGVQTHWVYGFLVRAMNLGCPLLLDEISQLEKEILSHIYYAIEYKRLHLEEAGEIITAKSGFQVFGTDNALTDTTGLYSGYGMSIALTNRFKFVYADYMDSNSEIRIFQKHGVDLRIATKLRTLLDSLRKLYNQGVIEFAPSTRTGKEIAKELVDGQHYLTAIKYCISDGLKPADAGKINAEATKVWNN